MKTHYALAALLLLSSPSLGQKMSPEVFRTLSKKQLQSGVRRTPSGAPEFERIGQKAVVTQLGNETVYTLPFRFRAMALQPGGGEKEVDVEALVTIRRNMRFTAEGAQFEGSLLVGLRNVRKPRASHDLKDPIALQVTAPDADGVAPEAFFLSHVNKLDEQVDLTAVHPGGDFLDVRVVPASDPEGATVELPIDRPEVSVTATPSGIPGFGLGTSRIELHVDGSVVEGATLSADKGSIEEGTRVRSTGVDGTTVTVEHPSLGNHEVQVDFEVPYGYVLASLLGGFLGGLASAIRRGKSKPQLLRAGLAGLVIGLIWAVAYAFGVKAIAIDVGEHFSEGAVFTVAALTAMAQARIGGKRKEDPARGLDPLPNQTSGA